MEARLRRLCGFYHFLVSRVTWVSVLDGRFVLLLVDMPIWLVFLRDATVLTLPFSSARPKPLSPSFDLLSRSLSRYSFLLSKFHPFALGVPASSKGRLGLSLPPVALRRVARELFSSTDFLRRIKAGLPARFAPSAAAPVVSCSKRGAHAAPAPSKKEG